MAVRAIVLALSLSAAAAQAAVHVVSPTGEFPADQDNVQAAVDLGGSVLLKATNAAGVPTVFDFGPADETGGEVVLTRDVSIRGEPGTTIEGGFLPFFGVEKTYTRIEGIHFVGPLLSAVIIIASSGADIVHNRITGVVGEYLPFLDAFEGRGIKFLGNNDPAGAITGRVRVSDNVIEEGLADLSDAIVFDAVAADVEIERNVIDTAQSSSGIFMIFSTGDVRIERNVIDTTESSGIFMGASTGDVRIRRNVITPGPGGDGPFSAGNGMEIFLSAGGRYDISNNKILCENPNADGIILWGEVDPGSTVWKNEVTMVGSLFGGLTFAGDVSYLVVAQNRVRGSGAYAIDFLDFSGEDDSGFNLLWGNDIEPFEASVADVFLDVSTHDFLYIGYSGTVIDLGTNNHFIPPHS